MSYDSIVDFTLDNGLLPLAVIRQGIRRQLRQRIQEIKKTSLSEAYATKMKYIELLRTRPIAIETATANTQHYEVGTGVLQACLGKRMKYSCCRYYNDDNTPMDYVFNEPSSFRSPSEFVFGDSVSRIENRLTRAEEAMLNEYVTKADVQDGQKIFDLGCGWGSLSLYLAERFPRAAITALSNSKTQKAYIDVQAKKLGLTNLTVITADISTFTVPAELQSQFDRLLSIEMFEHMKNYSLLLKKVSQLLRPSGKAFVHIFAHKDMPYDFESGWMTEHFFTGGTMPSLDLLSFFQEDLDLKQMWYVNGRNYAQTCEDWLSKMNASQKEIWPHLEETYGKNQTRKWFYRWQVFYMACAELFAYEGGEVWGVGHYLFEKPAEGK